MAKKSELMEYIDEKIRRERLKKIIRGKKQRKAEIGRKYVTQWSLQEESEWKELCADIRCLSECFVRLVKCSNEHSGLHLHNVCVSESDIDAMFPYEDITEARPERPENRIRTYNNRQADRREGAKRLLQRLHSR